MPPADRQDDLKALQAAAFRLREFCGKATPGPWVSRNTGSADQAAVLQDTGKLGERTRMPLGPSFCGMEGPRAVWDAIYIATLSPVAGLAMAALFEAMAAIGRDDPGYLGRVTCGREILALAYITLRMDPDPQ